MNEFKRRLVLGVALLLLAMPTAGFASPASAFKRYTAGKYESALREYKRLLIEKPDDPRLHFNAGAAAFQVKDDEETLKHWTHALATPDLQLEEQVYYNLGNTHFRLGEEAKALEKKQAAWDEAIAQYDSALKLNPNDQDAKFNLDLVKAKLEELKRARLEADEMVRKRKYEKALKIMADELGQREPTKDEIGRASGRGRGEISV